MKMCSCSGFTLLQRGQWNQCGNDKVMSKIGGLTLVETVLPLKKCSKQLRPIFKFFLAAPSSGRSNCDGSKAESKVTNDKHRIFTRESGVRVTFENKNIRRVCFNFTNTCQCHVPNRK